MSGGRGTRASEKGGMRNACKFKSVHTKNAFRQLEKKNCSIQPSPSINLISRKGKKKKEKRIKQKSINRHILVSRYGPAFIRSPIFQRLYSSLEPDPALLPVKVPIELEPALALGRSAQAGIVRALLAIALVVVDDIVAIAVVKRKVSVGNVEVDLVHGQHQREEVLHDDVVEAAVVGLGGAVRRAQRARVVVDGEALGGREARPGRACGEGREDDLGELHGEGPGAFVHREAEPFVLLDVADFLGGHLVGELAVGEGGGEEGGEDGLGEEGFELHGWGGGFGWWSIGREDGFVVWLWLWRRVGAG